MGYYIYVYSRDRGRREQSEGKKRDGGEKKETERKKKEGDMYKSEKGERGVNAGARGEGMRIQKRKRKRSCRWLKKKSETEQRGTTHPT